MDKIKQIRIYLKKYCNAIMLALFILNVVAFTSVYAVYTIKSAGDGTEHRLDSLNYIGKIKHMKETFQKYKESSSIELHTRWLVLFDEAVYRSGGNSNFDKYDCISSSWKFWSSMGANIQIESIPRMVARLKYTSHKIRNIKKVEKGDIIVFRPIYVNKIARWHVGVVEKVFNGKILYMDVNAKLGSRDFKHIRIYDRKVYGVYKMTFAYWIGELYGKFKL